MSEQELLPNGSIEAYSPFVAQLAELEQRNASLVFDYEDENGATEAKKHIRELKKTKSALEKVRKSEKQASLEHGRLVDSEAKAIASRVDGMIEVHAKPLQEIEEREKVKTEALKERVRAIYAIGETPGAGTLAISNTLAIARDVVVDNSFLQYKAAAALAKQETIEALEIALAESQERDELEALQRAENEKAQAEREEKLMAEAAAKAVREAEKKAALKAADVEKAHAAELAAEQAKKEAAEKEAAAEVARIEKNRVDALAKEKAAKEKAESAEIKRQSDKKHRAKIQEEIIAALNQIVPGASEDILNAIDAGEIPYVSINY